MATEGTATPPASEKEKKAESQSFDYNEFLSRLWSAKLWILLSVIICCGVSYYNYKRKAPLYTSQSEVLFLFGNTGSSQGTNSISALRELSQSGGQSSVNMINEMEVFHSPSLMMTVVERLNLNTTYSTDGFGFKTDLYGTNPVIVTFLDVPSDGTASLILRKSGSGHVIATNFILNGKPVESTPIRIPLSTVVESPVGKISVSPTTDFANFPDIIYVNKFTVEGTASNMAASVNTERKAEFGSIMMLSYSDVNAKRANDVVNGLVDAYNDLWVEEQNRSAINTSNFINDRLAVIEKELNGIDTDISQVKRSNPMGDVTGAAQAFYSQSMTYDAQAYEASTQLSIAQFLREHITSNPDALIPANTGASGSIEAQIQEYNKMLVKRDNLLRNSTVANPVIAQMNSDLAANRQLILQSLANIISTYQIQANRAAGRGNSFAGKVSSVPEQEKQILSIERQQKVKENLYVYLLQKREENELSRMITVNNTRVLRKASAVNANQLRFSKAVGIGLLIGLAIPALIIFLMMQFNTKVTRKSDLVNISVPFLGEMPLSPKRRKKSYFKRMLFPRSRKVDDAELEIVVRERSRSYINEAFRMIRTNLDFMAGSDNNTKVIMLTSFNPGSGKTFISMNMAKSLALKGKKVVVVDVDLRRASLSKYAGNATQGVTTYLTGKATSVASIIVHSESNLGVDLLPVGAIPPNPVELLLSNEFVNLIDELRKTYDYIVLDCPPYDLVADTAILARVADLTVFIIRAGLFNKAMLPELEELYKSGKLPHMSVVLNGIDPTKSYYNNRYGYKGYSGYYGHNSYYINDDDDQ